MPKFVSIPTNPERVPKPMSWRWLVRSVVGGLLLACTAGAALAQHVLTVGPSPACDVNSASPAVPRPITAALALVPDGMRAELRLVAGHEYRDSFEPPNISAPDQVLLRIRGDYASCAAAAANQSTPGLVATLRPLAQDTVNLLNMGRPVQANAERVELIALHLRPSLSPANQAAAFVQGSVDLVLQDVRVQGFDNPSAGSALVLQNDALLMLQNSTIVGNQALSGAGISCLNSYINIDWASRMEDNRAIGGDGGAILAQRCFLRIAARRHLTDPGQSDGGFIGNQASGDGGAIWMQGGVLQAAGGPGCFTFGLPCPPGVLSFRANRAGGRGGAIALSHEVNATIDSFEFIDNLSGLGGGAISVRGPSDGASLQIGVAHDALAPAVRALSCPEGYCGRFAGNQVRDGTVLAGFGGAISADQSASVVIEATRFVGNAAAAGTAVHVGAQSQGILRNSLVRGVPGSGMVEVLASGGSQLSIRHSTIEGRGASMAAPAVLLLDSSLSMIGSYLRQMGSSGLALSRTSGSVVGGDCNAHSGAMLDAQIMDSSPVSPESVTGGDLLPVPGSWLIDRCSPSANLQRDLRGQAREVQSLSCAVPGAWMDIGARELGSDLVFHGGFQPPANPCL